MAKEGQFPYQVSLLYDNEHSCGAVILSDRWIVTAAHCSVSPSHSRIIVGTNNWHAGDEYEVEKVVEHRYDEEGNRENDIALVKAKKPIQFSDRVKPIKIRSEYVGSGEEAVVSGWGRYNMTHSSESMNFIALKTISNEECKKLSKFPDMIYATSLCTFTKADEGVCFGDSGGPLVVDGELVGLVSWGQACALGYPDVYTRVSEYREWVREEMEKN